MSNVTLSDFLLIVLSFFVPFIVVGIRRGFCTAEYVFLQAFLLSFPFQRRWLYFSFLINICLCALGIPGIIHAIYIVIKYPRTVRLDIENSPNDPLVRYTPNPEHAVSPHSGPAPPSYSSLASNGMP